jgi:hypothetical protein
MKSPSNRFQQQPQSSKAPHSYADYNGAKRFWCILINRKTSILLLLPSKNALKESFFLWLNLAMTWMFPVYRFSMPEIKFNKVDIPSPERPYKNTFHPDFTCQLGVFREKLLCFDQVKNRSFIDKL